MDRQRNSLEIPTRAIQTLSYFNRAETTMRWVEASRRQLRGRLDGILFDERVATPVTRSRPFGF